MSSTNRTTSKGGKGAKTDKTHKTDGGKGGSEKVHNKENSTKNEELIIKEKVKQLMDLTCRSENEVCLALHENNNDVNMAINFLFEEVKTGEWEIKDKKKKKRQASTGKPEKKGGDAALNSDDWNENAPPLSASNNIGSGDGKDFRGRGSYRDNKNGGPPRRWRDDGAGRGGDRRGGSRGPSRGGGIGRGRGGGRAGGRYPPRGNRNGGGSGGGRDYNRQPIDTWDNSNTWDNSTAAVATNHVPAADDWDEFHTDEWSTEEYTGSLVETKVFTPSVQQNLQENLLESAQGQTNSATFDQNITGSATENNYSQSLSQTYNQTMQPLPPTQQSPVPPIVGTLTPAQSQYLSQLSQQNSDSLGKQYVNSSYPTQQQTGYDVKVQPVYNSSSQVYAPSSQAYNSAAAAGGGGGAAGATAQSFSSSTTAQQQSYGNSASSQQPYGNVTQAYGNPVAQTYGSAQQQQQQQQQSYGSSNSANNAYNTGGYQTSGGGAGGGSTTYGSVPDGQPSQPPQRAKTQRARVPPPSKIPASAVEMPGDLNSSITYLDVQFGAMDLIDSSFESSSVGDVKFGADSNRTSSLDNSRTTPTSSTLDHNSSTGNTVESGYGSGAGKNTAQSSITSALSQGLSNTENIPQTSEHLSYNNATASRSTAQGSNVTSSGPPVTTPSGLDLKQSTDSHSYNSQPASYSSYQSKASNYNASPYNAAQTTTSSYVNPAATSYVNNQAANSYAGAGVQNSSAGASSYGNSYSATGAAAAAAAAATQAYQNAANSYPSVTQTGNSYQANVPPSYASNFTSSTNQYNSYNSASAAAGGHKLGGTKENSYDATGTANVSASASTTTSSGAATSGGGTALSSLGQSTINTSKNTATLAKSSTSVMSNIPPGVTPVMSTPYIMGQVPYFPPTVYSYEEMQLLQQRMPHMTTPYYDMGYQTPTTLAAVRGDPTGALSGYGAAAADGRFQTTGRAGDGTTSPVPAASQQQQQQQQQPILAAATGGAQPYFIATAAFNTIPAANYAQFGTMYTQLPAVTNAHGSSASSQYGPKPGSYGSAAGYGAYDALSQSTQDYAKGGYALSNAAAAAAAAAQQAVQKSQTNSTSANSATNDLGAMYGKSHAALGKVNSYDKQGFHSGTPPPFGGALSQSAGLAPSGTGYAPPVYIPTMPQHHSTMAMHQPLHQMDVRHQGRRADSGNSGGQRSQGSNQAKSGSKQGYGNSYWNQN